MNRITNGRAASSRAASVQTAGSLTGNGRFRRPRLEKMCLRTLCVLLMLGAVGCPDEATTDNYEPDYFVVDSSQPDTGPLDAPDTTVIDTGAEDTAIDTAIDEPSIDLGSDITVDLVDEEPGCVDPDDDGHGPGCEAGPDCATGDRNVWESCDTCDDEDLDGVFAGCDAYITISGPDCAPDIGTAYLLTYPDADGDLYASEDSVNSAQCTGFHVAHLGLTPYLGDCDDTDPWKNPSAPDVPGDGVDTNCDDRDVPLDNARAVYVDANAGRAGGAGTLADPLDTLAAGVALAESEGRIVVVAEGNYDALTGSTVSLFGGWHNDAGTWTHDPSTYASVIAGLTVNANRARLAIDGFEVHVVSSAPVIASESCDGLAFTNNTIVIEDEAVGRVGLNLDGPDCGVTLVAGTMLTVVAPEGTVTNGISVEGNVAVFDNVIDLSGGAQLFGLQSGGGQARFARNTITAAGASMLAVGIHAGTLADAPGFVRIEDSDVTVSSTGTAEGIICGTENDGACAITHNVVTVEEATTGRAVVVRDDCLLERNLVVAASGTGLLLRHGILEVVNNAVFMTTGTPISLRAERSSIINNTLVTGGDGNGINIQQEQVSGMGLVWVVSEAVLVNNAIDIGDGFNCLISADNPPEASLHLHHNNCVGNLGATFIESDLTQGEDLADGDSVDACDWHACASAAGNAIFETGLAGGDQPIYALAADSDLIDAGVDPSTVQTTSPVVVDLDGDLRPLDGDGVDGAAWDIGADEAPASE